MYNPYFKLPEISFIGGEHNPYRFNLKSIGGDDFDVGSTAKFQFSVVSYFARGEQPLLSKPMTLRQDEDGLYCIAEVVLDPDDTVDLHGVYVYQISFLYKNPKTQEERIRIPGKGVLKIGRNIDPGFIS